MFRYTLASLGCVFAQAYPVLLGLRFLAGMMGSAPMSNSSGLCADIWSKVDRGTAMSYYSVGTFAGPSCGSFLALDLVKMDSDTPGIHRTTDWGVCRSISWMAIRLCRLDRSLRLSPLPHTLHSRDISTRYPIFHCQRAEDDSIASDPLST